MRLWARAADFAARRERWIYWAPAVAGLPLSTRMGSIVAQLWAAWSTLLRCHCVAW